MKTIREGAYYLDGDGNIAGPMRKSTSSFSAKIYPFCYDDVDRDVVERFTEDGKYFVGKSSHRDLCLTEEVVMEELEYKESPQPANHPPVYIDKNGVKHNGGGFPYPKIKITPKPPVVVPPLPQRRRVLNMNHGKTGAEIAKQDPWKILSIWEDDVSVIPLAEVQHLEKQWLKNPAGEKTPNGLFVITSYTRWDATMDQWANPAFVSNENAAAFIYQFKKYREDVENPQRIIEMVAEEVGKKHSKKTNKSSVEFKYIDAKTGQPSYDEEDYSNHF